MSADLERIDGLVEGVADAIDAARRLVRTGHGVDLAPLEDDVRDLTGMIVELSPESGGALARRLGQQLRAIAEGLDRLEADLTTVMPRE